MLLPQERIPWILRKLAFRPDVLFRIPPAYCVAHGTATCLGGANCNRRVDEILSSPFRGSGGSSSPVYLTFDDGPIPESTPWLLETLERYGAKATFFMVADNARRYPDLFRAVVEAGHAIGNHTFHHRPPFRQSLAEFLTDVHLAEEALWSVGFPADHQSSPFRGPGGFPVGFPADHQSSPFRGPGGFPVGFPADHQSSPFRGPGGFPRLFRPPHGLIRRSQQKALQKEGYRIVMFDLNTLDYRPDRTPEQILASVKANVRPGSIINLHDSLKSIAKLKLCLPSILSFLKAEGYRMLPLIHDKP